MRVPPGLPTRNSGVVFAGEIGKVPRGGMSAWHLFATGGGCSGLACLCGGDQSPMPLGHPDAALPWFVVQAERAENIQPSPVWPRGEAEVPVRPAPANTPAAENSMKGHPHPPVSLPAASGLLTTDRPVWASFYPTPPERVFSPPRDCSQ